MNMIFNPILNSFDKKYRLSVKFKNLNPENEPVESLETPPLNNSPDKNEDNKAPF